MNDKVSYVLSLSELILLRKFGNSADRICGLCVIWRMALNSIESSSVCLASIAWDPTVRKMLSHFGFAGDYKNAFQVTLFVTVSSIH